MLTNYFRRQHENLARQNIGAEKGLSRAREARTRYTHALSTHVLRDGCLFRTFWAPSPWVSPLRS